MKYFGNEEIKWGNCAAKRPNEYRDKIKIIRPIAV